MREAEGPASEAGERERKAAKRRRGGDPGDRALSLSRNRHLHLPLLVALAVALGAAVVVPITQAPADGEPTAVHAFSIGQSPAADAASRASLRHSSPVVFTVHGEGLSVRHTTWETTVGRALASVGIEISDNDEVVPAPDASLTSGGHVFISHARAVRLILGSSQRLVYTRAQTVGDLLREAGIEPQEGDRIFPGLSDPIRGGMSVSFVTFRDGVEFSEERVGFSTVYEDDPDLLEGEQRLVSAGVEGYVRREYRVTRINGQETGRELVSEVWFSATDEVLAVGTKPAATTVASAQGGQVSFDGLVCVQTMNVYATWYTAASAGGGGVTATGSGVYKGIVAVDPRVIPLGTRMWIPGYGYGVAADTGAGVVGTFIDLGYGPEDVVDWRSRYLDICILG